MCIRDSLHVALAHLDQQGIQPLQHPFVVLTGRGHDRGTHRTLEAARLRHRQHAQVVDAGGLQLVEFGAQPLTVADAIRCAEVGAVPEVRTSETVRFAVDGETGAFHFHEAGLRLRLRVRRMRVGMHCRRGFDRGGLRRAADQQQRE